MSPLEAIVALNMLPKLGPIRTQRLLDAFLDARTILHTPKNQLMRVDGIGPETADSITGWQNLVDPSAEIKEARDREITIITRDDENYPVSLRHVYDAPMLLYVWGEIKKHDRHAIGIVGSRRTSHYGKQSTKKISYQLAHSGFTIVSGLARGIDTTAHEAAIAANGRTIAVIGSGLAKLYPPENFALAEKIASGFGAVISEFPLHTAPSKQTFPMRNRIVAAWANAILVTECPAWSGSLITANLASDYGKPIFAIPGPIDKPTSAGCNQLIRDGATLVSDANHITDDLGELPLRFQANPMLKENDSPTLPENEAKVMAMIGYDEVSIDDLITRSKMTASEVGTTLTKLEMRRLIKVLPGFRYCAS